MLNSAAGVILPPESEPPIRTMPLTNRAKSGSVLKAIAILVRGPTGIRVTSPGYFRTILQISSAADSGTGLIFGSGNTAPPNPLLPCAYSAVTRRRRSGTLAPAATGISVRPAISTMRMAFGRVNSRGTFPDTAVMASIFSSGDRMANSNANASSTPVSVSRMTRDGADAVCGSSAPLSGGSVPASSTPDWRQRLQERTT